MKIKVLYCMQSLTTGGVEKRRLSLARHLGSEYELKIVCTQYRGKIADDLRDMGVDVIAIGDIKGVFHFSQYAKVLKIIRNFKPHIIHGAVYEGVMMACITGFLGRVPVIIAEETSDPRNRKKRATWLLKLVTLAADKVIAIAPNVADYLIKTAKISSNKVITINNGVEIPRVVSIDEIEELKQKYLIKQSDFIVGSVGRLHNDHKKFTDILIAIASLPYPNIKLLIVGGGNDEQLIRQKARDLAIEERLIMTGFQYDMAVYYQMMDVFCLASQREGFGLVAAEAMLNKKPVVATRVGGLQDVVDDNITGFLVTPNSPDELAVKLSELYESPALRQSFAEKGYSKAVNNFTERRYVNNVRALYSDYIDYKGLIN